jgi:hypothetical protein
MTNRPQVLVRCPPGDAGEIRVVGALEPDCLPELVTVVRRAQGLVGELVVDVSEAQISPIALTLLQELAHGDVRGCKPFAVRTADLARSGSTR